MHGFCSATVAHDIAEDDDGRSLIGLYVGDWDPSGLYMSERDLPDRLEKYEGYHVEVNRIALVQDQLRRLPSFPATDKRKDPRFQWFVENYGERCWEIDALDPNILRACVEEEIKSLIEPKAWERCEQVNEAERASLRDVLSNWAGRASGRRQ
jgi:hypothetical protein